MPRFKGVNFVKGSNAEIISTPVAKPAPGEGHSDVQGTRQNSKSQKRKNRKKNISIETSVRPMGSDKPASDSIKEMKQDVKVNKKRKRKKFKKAENQGMSTSEKSEDKSNTGNGTLLLVNQKSTGISAGKGSISEKSGEKLSNKSLLLLNQKNTKPFGRAKKRKKDFPQRKNALSSPKQSTVLQANRSEVGAETRLQNKKKRKFQKKKNSKQELSMQPAAAADSSQTSDGAEKSEVTDQAADGRKRIEKEKRKNKFRLKMLERRKEKGITMLSDTAERKLYLLRKSLRKRGKSPKEIKSILRVERRRAELQFRKMQGTVCFRCRQQGHLVANCTTILEDDEQGMGICFRCGSTEHILRRCPVKNDNNALLYAKCFVCSRRGHLSSKCPKNAQGVFPKGGSCLLCQSVNHMKKDCPTLMKNADDSEQPNVAIRGTAFESADAEISDDDDEMPEIKKSKVVTF